MTDTSQKSSTEDKKGQFSTYLVSAAALIAAMMPLTAFVNGCYSVKIERDKFFIQMRLNYLDRALDTTRDANYREGVIRFLLETTEPSDPLYKWALKQTKIADEIHRLRDELVKLDAGWRAAQSLLIEEQRSRSSEKSVASVRERELLGQLKKMSKDRAELEKDLRSAQLEAGRSVDAQEKASVPPVAPKQSGNDAPPQIFGVSVNPPLRPASVQNLGGPATLVISGRGLGDKPGRVYIVNNPEGSQSWELLGVTSWSDEVVYARLNLPAYWQEGPEIYIGITTATSQVIDPVPIQVHGGRGGGFEVQ